MSLPDMPTVPSADASLPGSLELGAFSMSLNVADLDASIAFYSTLGFVATGGSADDNYVIMKNGESTIGLFHGMFDGNILTFNPGLTSRMERLENFTDVREIEQRLIDDNIELEAAVSDEAGDSGPAHVVLVDPDGNTVMVDQFFASE